MINFGFRGPEAAGFVILGATVGVALTSLVHPGVFAAWAGGTAGAVLVPVGFALPWAGAVRRVVEVGKPSRSRTA